MDSRQLDFYPLWSDREHLEDHLAAIGLREPLRRFLLHLLDTCQQRDEEDDLTVRQASLPRLALELGCSVRSVTDWRNDLLAYGFLSLHAPPRGRTLILCVHWGAVKECDRISDAGPSPLAWIRLDEVRPTSGFPAPAEPVLQVVGEPPINAAADAAAHAAGNTAADAAAHAAGNAAADAADSKPVLIKDLRERKKEGRTQSVSLSEARETGLLETLPRRVWEASTSDAGLYAVLKTWWGQHGEAARECGWTAEALLAGILATRSLHEPPRMPLRYLLTCLKTPKEDWLAEARRWKSLHGAAAPYAAYGVPQ